MNFKKFLTLLLTFMFIGSNSCFLYAMNVTPHGNAQKNEQSKKKLRIRCEEQGCTVSPFSTMRSLKSHKALVHCICPYCPELVTCSSYEELINEHYPVYNHPIDYCTWCKKYVCVDHKSSVERHKKSCSFNPEKHKKWSKKFTEVVRVDGGKYDLSIVVPRTEQNKNSPLHCSTGLNKLGKNTSFLLKQNQRTSAVSYHCSYHTCFGYTKPFDKQEDLSSHLLIEHHRCPYQRGLSCSREFTSRASLITHYTKVNHAKDFCSYCQDFIVLPSDRLLLEEHTIDCKKRWLEKNLKASQSDDLSSHGTEVLATENQETLPLYVETGCYFVLQSPKSPSSYDTSLCCGIAAVKGDSYQIVDYRCNNCLRLFGSEEEAFFHINLRECCL